MVGGAVAAATPKSESSAIISVVHFLSATGVFRHTPGSGLPGMPTQFSRAMEELGIQMIFALSPQGKGRVERAAGTFQDRLVTELRLANAGSILEANRVLEQFLPRFNQRFGVPPLYPEPAFRPPTNYIPCSSRRP